MINILEKRNLLFQFSKKSNFSTVYAGFDGTAISLQIGNLTPLTALRHLSNANVNIIVLLGGATSKIGDPSGKTETRAQLAEDIVIDNIIKIEQQIRKLLPNAIIVNNYDWISKLDFMNFLDKVAHYVSVSKIINLKTFSERLEKHQPFTIKEMLYPLLQGYDFLHLFEQYNCNAQIGGQDQWCNLLTGTDLIKTKYPNAEPIAITCPLLVDSSGRKMGKSLNGAIYLSKELCSVYDFWHFWRNIDDQLVKTCLKRFTLLALEYIEEICQDINKAKIVLANEITTWVHSKEEAIEAAKKAQEIFYNKNYDILNIIAFKANDKLFHIISKLKNISNSEAKKLIENDAILIDDQKTNDTNKICSNGTYIIKIGKKSTFKIQII